MSYWRRASRFLTAGLLVLLFSFTSLVTAQEPGGSGLQISPTRTELTISPGELKSVTLTIKNVTSGDIVARAFLNDFESDNLTGEPKISVNTTERGEHSLEPFIKGLTDVELKAGESKEVTVTLDAPGDIPPGAYYGAIRFAAVPKGQAETTDERQVSLTASVASLVLVEVTGNITEQIQVRGVRVEQNGTASTFFTKVPHQVAVEIKNIGNGFAKPFGRVTVTNMRGKEVFAYELNNKDPRGNVLPDSTRIFKDDIKNVNRPGRYTVVASVSHGSGGEVLIVRTSFWYVPLWLILVILLVIGAVVALIYFWRRRSTANRRSAARKR